MHPAGHQGVALLLYAPLAFFLLLQEAYILALCGLFIMFGLAMFPDIDMRLPWVPHRGPTHTVWFALVTGGGVAIIGLLAGRGIVEGVTWVTEAFAGVLTTADVARIEDFSVQLSPIRLAAFGFVVGTLSVISHLLGDALTPMGIAPFSLAPFSSVADQRYSLNITKAANPLLNTLLFLGGWVAIGVAIVAAVPVFAWV